MTAVLDVLLLLIVLFGIVGTLIPTLPVSMWWVRAFDFPRFQIAGLLAVFGGMYAAYLADSAGEWIVVGLAAVSLVVQIGKMWPYTPLAPKQSKTARTIRPDDRVLVMVSNVRQSNHEAARALRVYQETDPDVLLTVETNGWWKKQLAPLEETYPHTHFAPLSNSYGMLLYSKLPIHHAETRFLIEDDVPSFKVQLELPSGQRFWFYGVHPRPPLPGKDTHERDAELVMVGKEVRQAGEPALVAGDLNDVAWSATTTLFQKASGMLDPRDGRRFWSSFSAEKPYLRFPLDHVFHTTHFTFVRMERGEKIGSDHFPILVELQYDPEGPQRQTAPQPNARERRKLEAVERHGKEQEAKEKARGEEDRTDPSDM